MNHSSENQSFENAEKKNWKNDPRLNQISPEKLNMLTNIVQNSKGLPNEALIPFFLNQTAAAGSKGINFSDAETELIIEVLKAGMTPEQIKQIDLVKKLSVMIANKSKKSG